MSLNQFALEFIWLGLLDDDLMVFVLVGITNEAYWSWRIAKAKGNVSFTLTSTLKSTKTDWCDPPFWWLLVQATKCQAQHAPFPWCGYGNGYAFISFETTGLLLLCILSGPINIIIISTCCCSSS